VDPQHPVEVHLGVGALDDVGAAVDGLDAPLDGRQVLLAHQVDLVQQDAVGKRDLLLWGLGEGFQGAGDRR
jgi:hypothetical protein